MVRNTETAEHILVCLSPSPSNPKVVEAAAGIADAFNASLTALYVKPTNYDSLPEEDKARLQNNIRFAEQKGASITTITGDDVPAQIAEYAHISETTKIVAGRSGMQKRHFWSRPPLTEQLILNVPDVDVYIIPDSVADLKQQKEKLYTGHQIRPALKDLIITVLILAACTGIGLLFTQFGFSESNIITVFILGVLVISVITVSPLFGALGSLASVLLFNWFFIDPKFSFHTYEAEYPVTFAIMLISSLITGTLANRIKRNARQSAREAFRTKILLDTSQLLQKAGTSDEILRITADQIIMLLEREVTIIPGSDKDSGEFRAEQNDADIQYYSISLNDYSYGAIAVKLNGRPLEPFENNILMSMLAECALALENLRNAEEKEQAALMARNEQLRSNLLRSISHDIRTPLTSISGNASNLLSHYRQLDDETREQIFSDIYDDSEWLIDLVENLLSISRIENGQMDLHLSSEVLGDVIEEALKHTDRNASRHNISVRGTDDILLVNMEAKLIMQVLINLVNNAIKNTQDGSDIIIESRQDGNEAIVTVRDNGPGIPDDIKPHVFEMFYTGQNKVADGRRGLGLGLALCRSIVEAHHGSITLTDNKPSGCCFTVSLPLSEVKVDE
ncbi:MAG: sensor histidine kinase KdpD [Firmicutes bacterium]|nr:sensor histidine kinase KdpD [Bacillota bacterium]